MFKFISRNILTGIFTILPLALTIYLLYWLAVSLETTLGDLTRLVIPDEKYRLGMGVMLGLIVMFLVGLLMHTYVMRRLFAYAEKLFYRVPLVKHLYLPIRDFFDYFSPRNKKEYQQVVAFKPLDSDMELVGFVTQALDEKLPEALRGDDRILVYLPMSYMIGGYTVVVPRDSVRPLDMSMEEAMRFVLTAGVTGNKRKVS